MANKAEKDERNNELKRLKQACIQVTARHSNLLHLLHDFSFHCGSSTIETTKKKIDCFIRFIFFVSLFDR